MGADLIRDIARKRKVSLFLDLTPKSMCDEPDSDSSLQAMENLDSDDDEPRRKRKRATMLHEEQYVGTARFGTRSKGMHMDAIPVDSVDALLPTSTVLPHARMRRCRFADRLGLYLTDGEMRLSGAYPRPDDGVVVLHRRVKIDTPAGRVVIRADSDFRGHARYSFVELRAQGRSWYGQVIALMTFKFNGALTAVALVNYLDLFGDFNAICPNKEGYRWYSQFPDCLEVDNIIRSVCMLPAPDLVNRDPVFVLMNH